MLGGAPGVRLGDALDASDEGFFNFGMESVHRAYVRLIADSQHENGDLPAAVPSSPVVAVASPRARAPAASPSNGTVVAAPAVATVVSKPTPSSPLPGDAAALAVLAGQLSQVRSARDRTIRTFQIRVRSEFRKFC